MSEQDQHPAETADIVEDAQWALYESVMDAFVEAQIPFALGGAFGVATYTGLTRTTKDLDLYILPSCREKAIDVVGRLRLADYFDQVPYDRKWIHRATTDGMIVDIIWAMANGRAEVDGWWLSGPSVQLRGRTVRVLPAEVMLWDKLYILQKERCDWPDVLNLLYQRGETLAWSEVVRRLDDDLPLLAGVLSVFRWLSPAVAARLPGWLCTAVNLPAAQAGCDSEIVAEHVRRLDSRPWYAQKPTIPENT
jgi:hypothetical protein